jgi:hypothetical protein
MKIFCTSCNKITDHRSKLGGSVCNVCDKINYPVYLVRTHDNRSNGGSIVKWIEWDSLGKGKKIHDEPQLGFSLCIDPKVYNFGEMSTPSFQWMTTEVTEIIEHTRHKDHQIIKFKTKNSEYTLYQSNL